MERPRPDTVWLLGSAGLLVLVAVSASGGGVMSGSRPRRLRLPPTPPLPDHVGTPAPTATAPLPSAAGHSGPPDLTWLGRAAVVVLALLLAVLLLLLLRSVSRRGEPPVPSPLHVDPGPPRTGAPGQEAAQALRVARAALAAEGSPRQRVMRCWVGLEEAVAAMGAARGPGEAPGELASRVLSAHGGDPAALRELHRLYGSARYSPVEVGPEAPERAAALLRAVEQDLASPRGE